MNRNIESGAAGFVEAEVLIDPLVKYGDQPLTMRRTGLVGVGYGLDNPEGISVIGVSPLLARAHDWDYAGKQLHIEAKQQASLDLTMWSTHNPHCATVGDCADMAISTAYYIKEHAAEGHRIFFLEKSKGGLVGAMAASGLRGQGVIDGQVSFGTPYDSAGLSPELLLSFESEVRGSLKHLKGPEGRVFAKFLGTTSLYTSYLLARHPNSFKKMLEDVVEEAKPDHLIAASRHPQHRNDTQPVPSYVFHYSEDGVAVAERQQQALDNARFAGRAALVDGVHLTLMTDYTSRKTALNCLLEMPKPVQPHSSMPAVA